jgi:hypothetical protein
VDPVSAPAHLPDETARLADLAASGVLGTPAEERFDRVTRLCRRLFGVEMAFVNLVDRDRTWTKSASGFAVEEVPRGDSFCTHAIQEEDGLVVGDTRADGRFSDNPFVSADPGVRFYAGMPISGPGGHRVGTLCVADSRPRQMSPADRELLRDLALWVEKELNIDEELDRAADVQRALLPGPPPRGDGWELAGTCRPSRDVGGDFYDWYPLDGEVVVALADVMGKGMPAAIVAASVRAALRSASRGSTPGTAIRHAADSLADDLAATGVFATAFVVRLCDDGLVEYADAGHGQAVIVRADGRIDALAPGGLPIGIEAGEAYGDHVAQLHEGDLLLVHSDGLTDAGTALRTTAQAAALLLGVPDARAGVERLMGVLGRGTPPDDVTVLVARRAA